MQSWRSFKEEAASRITHAHGWDLRHQVTGPNSYDYTDGERHVKIYREDIDQERLEVYCELTGAAADLIRARQLIDNPQISLRVIPTKLWTLDELNFGVAEYVPGPFVPDAGVVVRRLFRALAREINPALVGTLHQEHVGLTPGNTAYKFKKDTIEFTAVDIAPLIERIAIR